MKTPSSELSAFDLTTFSCERSAGKSGADVPNEAFSLLKRLILNVKEKKNIRFVLF